MRRVSLLLLFVAACGGPQIPAHNGYKSDKAKPWKKAHILKWDAQNESKADGDLSYPDMRRAAWFQVDTPGPGDLTVRVEAGGPGEGVNPDFDLGIEVLDPGNRMLVRKDLEEGDQQQQDVKTLGIPDLPQGRYLIHLYLQGRLDTSDYSLHVTFKSGKAAGHSDFPAQVAFTPPLAMVPINDDTPKSYKPPPPPVVVTHTVHKHEPTPKKDDKPPPVKMTARILGISVVATGTQITIGRGTATGASAGMPGQIVGVANGGFTLAACNDHTCTAVVKASKDDLKSAFSVQLGQ